MTYTSQILIHTPPHTYKQSTYGDTYIHINQYTRLYAKKLYHVNVKTNSKRERKIVKYIKDDIHVLFPKKKRKRKRH